MAREVLLSRVAAHLRALPPQELSQGLLLACSGGADSTALLLLLHKLSHTLSFPLWVLHVDHGLRHTSAGDARFVEALCRARSLPFALRRLDGSREDEASLRKARRALLLDYCNRINSARIVTAHTAGDQAETLLMRLIRGAGPRGLGAMHTDAPPWFKPLLETERHELIDYLYEQRQAWREDETNQSKRYLRNRIRHHLLPWLKKENPAIVATLTQTARALQEEVRGNTLLYEEARADCIPFELGSLWPRERIKRFGLPLLERALREVWGDCGGGSELQHKHVVATLALLDAPGGRPLQLPSGMGVERMGEWLYMGPQLQTPHFEASLPAPGCLQTPRGEWGLWPGGGGGEQVGIPNEAWPLTLRYKRPGDRLQRKGLGPVRLKKVLQKVPRRIKERLFCLVDTHGALLYVEQVGHAYGTEAFPRYTIHLPALPGHQIL